ncbi:hypothetical protein KY285_023492 [Solanum tuberosum]|nr:hypothetical protein KY285_023492 [Solanum tuberosum]
MEICRSLVYMAQNLYPWLHNLPSSWIDLVQFLEAYTPRIEYKMVYWKTPSRGYKCNTDGAAKGNPDPSSGAFCVRNEAGNLMYTKWRRFGVNSNLVAEVLAFRMGLEYSINHHYLPLTMETESLAILDGGWETPWCITVDITKIKSLLVESNTTVEHTYMEGNKLADFFAKRVYFAGTDLLTYSSIQEISREARSILQLDKNQTPNLRIKKIPGW